MNIKVAVTGLESIDADYNAEILNIKMAAAYALYNVFEDAKDALVRHIEEDVYSPAVFTPTVYPRRSEHPEFGPALTDMATNLRPYEPIPADMTGANWGGFKMSYMPSGEHRGTTADLEAGGSGEPRPIKAYPPYGDRVDNNNLIYRIETGRGYTWRRRPGERPFWQNFIDEMTDGGEFAKSFARHMTAQKYAVEDVGDVTRDYEDGNYGGNE